MADADEKAKDEGKGRSVTVKKKGGAEYVRIKKRKRMVKEAGSCKKITDLFSVTYIPSSSKNAVEKEPETEAKGEAETEAVVELEEAESETVEELEEVMTSNENETLQEEEELYFKRPTNDSDNLNGFLKVHPIQPKKIRPDWNAKLIYSKKDGVARNWLSYNSRSESVFCWVCMAFSKDDSIFVGEGSKVQAKHIYSRIEEHEKSRIHRNSCEAYLMYTSKKDVYSLYFSQAREQHERKVQVNRQILCRIIETIKVIGKRGMSYRGNANESAHFLADETLDHGNFLEMLLLIAKFDPLLRAHIDEAIDISTKRHRKPGSSKGRGNVTTFLSKTTVNVILEGISKLLKQKVSEEVQKSDIYSIQIDTTQDINVVDQCSVILRYVTDDNEKVNERLLAVINCKSSKGKDMHEMISELLKERKIDISRCVGNSTDGAANMQGQYSGFTSWLSKDSPKQIHVWCYAHVLNLVVTDTCNKTIPAITLFGLINKCAVFVRESYKRMNVWKDVAEKQTKFLNIIGDTRWWAKDKALRKIFSDSEDNGVFVELCQTLYTISMSDKFNSDTRYSAKTYLDGFLKFENILTALLFTEIFRHTTPLSLYLQTSGMDFLQSFRMVEDTIERLSSNSRKFDELYLKTKRFIEKVNEAIEAKNLPFLVEEDFPKTKRVIRKRKFADERCDDGIDDVAVKYRIDVYNVTMDAAINSMRSRFIVHKQLYADFECFHPSNFSTIAKNIPDNALITVVSTLKGFFPDLTIVNLKEELQDFASKWSNLSKSLEEQYRHNGQEDDQEEEEEENLEENVQEEGRREENVNIKRKDKDVSVCKTCRNCIFCCYKLLLKYNLYAEAYPKLLQTYKYLLTLSISQVSCERSFSKLKLILNRLRSNLTQEHVETFMLMSIEKDLLINLENEEIIDYVARKSQNYGKLLF